MGTGKIYRYKRINIYSTVIINLLYEDYSSLNFCFACLSLRLMGAQHPPVQAKTAYDAARLPHQPAIETCPPGRLSLDYRPHDNDAGGYHQINLQ